MKRNRSLTKKEREYLKEYGEKLRDIRKKADMSQQKLYTRTGISQSTICYYEKGEMPITITNLVKIAEALGYTVSLEIRKGGMETYEQS